MVVLDWKDKGALGWEALVTGAGIESWHIAQFPVLSQLLYPPQCGQDMPQAPATKDWSIPFLSHSLPTVIDQTLNLRA